MSSPARPPGNAASSLAGNAAAAGLQTFIFVPSRAPKGKVAQLMTFGATVISVQGSYEDTFELSKQGHRPLGLVQPQRGHQSLPFRGQEDGPPMRSAEQLDWQMPDFIAISVGDGCTIAGLWKGLKDPPCRPVSSTVCRASSPRRPRGCCPITPRHCGKSPVGAHGREHAGRLHRRRRAAQRGQGAHGHPRVERPWS